MVDRVSKTILEYEVNQASLAKIQRANDQAVASTKQAQQQVGTAYKSSADLGISAAEYAARRVKEFEAQKAADAQAAAQQIAQAQIPVTAAIDERAQREAQMYLESLRLSNDKVLSLNEEKQAVDRLTDSLQREQNIEAGGGGRGGGSSGRGGLSAAAQVLRGAGLNDAAAAVDFVDDAGRAITALSPAMLALTAAAGGVLIVGNEVAKMYDDQARSARNLINTQGDFFSATIGTTREELEAQAAAQRLQVDITRATTEELNRVVEQGYQETSETLGVFTDLFLETTNAGGARELRAARDAGMAQLAEETFLLGRLEAALAGNVTATADAAAAQEEADRRAEVAFENQRRRDEQALAAEISVARSIETLTAEQRARRIEAIEFEVAALIPYAEASADAALSIQTLRREQELLSAVTDTYADQLEREAQAKETLTTVTDSYFEAISDAAAALAAYNQAQIDLQDFEDQITAQRAQLEEKRRQAEKEAQLKADEARLKQAEDTERRRLEIERRANATLTNAIFDRNAVAYILAQQQKALELQKLKEDDAARQKEIKKQLDAQLKAIKEANQLDEAKYAQERRQREQAIQAAKVALENAQRNEEYLRRQYEQNQRAQQAQQNAALLNIAQQSSVDQINIANYTAAAIRAAYVGIAPAIGAIGGIGGGLVFPPLPPAALPGGVVTGGSIGAPLPSPVGWGGGGSQPRQAGAAGNFTIYIDGVRATTKRITNIADQRVNLAFDEYADGL